ARNKEFLRDRATLAWNFAFPFLVIFAIAVVFSGEGRELYKVGVIGLEDNPAARELAFLETRHVDFVPMPNAAAAADKVRHHQLDMALAPGDPPRYWINGSNPKGYVLERMLWGSAAGPRFEKEVLEGRRIRYVDWLLPGVL
ncbi:MAG: ABC transporter permease, partial [Gammaproteobacteria bacterium]|nr:ABC transporter permease [Gammaproteobacteria bacterium]